MDVISYLPDAAQNALKGIPRNEIYDIRLFAGGDSVAHTARGEISLGTSLGEGTLYELAQALSGRRLRLSHAGMTQGYIALRGGHRLGLCGQVTREQEGLMLHGIGSLCLRMAHEVKGCGEAVAALMQKCGGGVLIAGSPGAGKTTMLRDAVRLLSDGGIAAGLTDERGEIAACLEGVPQLDVGRLTHVLDGCPKADGMRWLIRSLCPQIVATDELYAREECAAVSQAAAWGVRVLATIHAGSAQQVMARRGVRALLSEGAISQVVFLDKRRIAAVMTAQEVLKA